MSSDAKMLLLRRNHDVLLIHFCCCCCIVLVVLEPKAAQPDVFNILKVFALSYCIVYLTVIPTVINIPVNAVDYYFLYSVNFIMSFFLPHSI